MGIAGVEKAVLGTETICYLEGQSLWKHSLKQSQNVPGVGSVSGGKMLA